ncbi:MAG: DMT family transporter [Puniceicoccaceae bacterium]
MIYLLAVSLLWGFSFGLIKTGFDGMDGSILAMMRLLIALPCFLPFLKQRFHKASPLALQLTVIGAVQFGLMYICLFSAFKYMTGYEVALLTIFTPLYVILADALLERRWPPLFFWLTSILAILGALWIFQPEAIPQKWPGILLMQGANACFAVGQIAWRRVRQAHPDMGDLDGYALLYLGGFLATVPFALPQGPFLAMGQLDGSQWLALLYLGTIASGLGFFLWNAGASRVNAASLAVFNNLKIPLATVISILVFREEANLGNLIPGLTILLVALAWAEAANRRTATSRSAT